MTRKLLGFFGLAVLGLQGCAFVSPLKDYMPVSPGYPFQGGYINISSPNSDGWHIVESSKSGMSFEKDGEAISESFSAKVLMFGLTPTNTPEEFEALIKKSAEKDTNVSRFNVQQISFKYSGERNYPCVRYHSIAEDKPSRGLLMGAVLIETEALYCRHPVRQKTGFAAIYSHRGTSPHKDFRKEAESFFRGVQVPDSDS